MPEVADKCLAVVASPIHSSGASIHHPLPPLRRRRPPRRPQRSLSFSFKRHISLDSFYRTSFYSRRPLASQPCQLGQPRQTHRGRTLRLVVAHRPPQGCLITIHSTPTRKSTLSRRRTRARMRTSLLFSHPQPRTARTTHSRNSVPSSQHTIAKLLLDIKRSPSRQQHRPRANMPPRQRPQLIPHLRLIHTHAIPPTQWLPRLPSSASHLLVLLRLYHKDCLKRRAPIIHT